MTQIRRRPRTRVRPSAHDRGGNETRERRRRRRRPLPPKPPPNRRKRIAAAKTTEARRRYELEQEIQNRNAGLQRKPSPDTACRCNFAATAASSGSRRDGIGFVLETFGAAPTVSLSDPLGGFGFEGGDMSGLDDGFDAFPDHDLHVL